jgi:hypothetical protein
MTCFNLRDNISEALSVANKARSLKLFTHQQMRYLLNLERFKLYTRIHTNIAPTCFGF